MIPVYDPQGGQVHLVVFGTTRALCWASMSMDAVSVAYPFVHLECGDCMAQAAGTVTLRENLRGALG